MKPTEKVLATARGEIGYLEKASNAQLDSKTANAGSKNWTKYARDLDKLKVYSSAINGYAWCAVFVFWCLVQAFGLETALKMTGQKMGGHGAGCTAMVSYYKAAGQFYQSGPRPGDQIFFSQDGGKTANHTGLVEKVQGGRVYTIEGNTSSAAGVVDNGGAVQDKSYSLSYSKICGYGRPKYELVKEENDMTGEEIYRELNNYLKKQPVPSWAKAELEEAVKLGITDGKEPMALIPRYQAAIMAKRAREGK